MKIFSARFHLLFAFAAFVAWPVMAASTAFVGNAAGISVVDGKNGRQIASGHLDRVPADSPAGEVLDSLRGAPGLAGARAEPESQVTIEYQDDRVYRVTVSVPGGAPATALSSPGGVTVRDAQEANVAGVLGIPRNGAIRIESIEGVGATRRVDLKGPLGQFPSSGPLSAASLALQESVQSHPASGAAPLDNNTPVLMKTDGAGKMLSFTVPGLAGKSPVIFSRSESGEKLSPAPETVPPVRSDSPAVSSPVSAPETKSCALSPVAFLVGDKPSVPPFVRALANGKSSEVTLAVSDLLPAARAQIARDLPGNTMAVRIGSAAVRPGDNARVTVGEREGAFTILNLVPAASVPRPAATDKSSAAVSPFTGAAVLLPGESGLRSGAPGATAEGLPLPPPSASAESANSSVAPASATHYFKSGDIPSISNTGADGGSGQHALPASYVAALTAARTAIGNIPPANVMGFRAALNTARVRLNDLSAAYTRIDGNDGFRAGPEAQARRARIFGSAKQVGSLATMNRSPSPETLLRTFSDFLAMNQHRR